MNKQKIILFVCGVLIVWKCFDYFIINNNGNNVIQSEELDALHSKEIFKISIYYEALCSDSRYFIMKQLNPTYDSLRDYMTLDFIPYGKAKVSV